MRSVAVILLALASWPACASVLQPVPGSTQGFIGFLVNEIGPPVAGDPVIVQNALAPSGLVRSPGGGLRGSAGAAPLFQFTGLVPLPLFASANGGDPNGRFGTGSATVQDGTGTIIFNFALNDLLVGDGFSSSVVARGAATYFNSTPHDYTLPSIGLSLAISGVLPANALGYAGLTGLVNGNSIRPAVLGMSGTDYGNAKVAYGDFAGLTYSNGGTSFSGYAVSLLRDGNGDAISLLLRPGETFSIDFALSALMDPGAGFEFGALPPGVAGPAFGAAAVSQAAVSEPGSLWLAAPLLAFLLWRSRLSRAAPLLLAAVAVVHAQPGCQGPVKILAKADNWNGFRVFNGGTPPAFQLGKERYCLAHIATYHWNPRADNTGQGKEPAATDSITVRTTDLKDPRNTVEGKWRPKGTVGDRNVQNANWEADPDRPFIVTGATTVIDSDPTTWSQNAASGTKGFARLWGRDYIALTIRSTTFPTGTKGSAFSWPVMADNASGTVTWTMSGVPGLRISPSGNTATVSGTPEQAGSFTLTILAKDASGAEAGDSFPVTIGDAATTPPPPPPTTGAVTITKSTLLPMTLGSGYFDAISAAGGQPPYEYTIVSGNLPAGISMDSRGVLSGTPVAAGQSKFTVVATDARGVSSPPKEFEAVVTEVRGPVSITTATLPEGQADQPYDFRLAAAGGCPPYTFEVLRRTFVTEYPALPAGLTLTADGRLTGVPAETGTRTILFSVTDCNKNQATRALDLRIAPRAPLTLQLNTAGGAKQNGEKVEVNPTVGGGRPSTRRVSVSGVTEAQGKVTLDPVSGKSEIEFKQPGTYRIQWTVSDGVSTPVTREATWVISRAMSLGLPTAGRSVPLNEAETYSVDKVFWRLGTLTVPVRDGPETPRGQPRPRWKVVISGDVLVGDPLDIFKARIVTHPLLASYRGLWNNGTWEFPDVELDDLSTEFSVEGLLHDLTGDELVISVTPMDASRAPVVVRHLIIVPYPFRDRTFRFTRSTDNVYPRGVPPVVRSVGIQSAASPGGRAAPDSWYPFVLEVDTASRIIGAEYAESGSPSSDVEILMSPAARLWLKTEDSAGVAVKGNCEPLAGGCIFSGRALLALNAPRAAVPAAFIGPVESGGAAPITLKVGLGPWDGCFNGRNALAYPCYGRPGESPNGASAALSTAGGLINPATGGYGPVAPEAPFVVLAPGLTDGAGALASIAVDALRMEVRDSSGTNFVTALRAFDGIAIRSVMPAAARPGRGRLTISDAKTGVPVAEVPIDIGEVVPGVFTSQLSDGPPFMQGTATYEDGSRQSLTGPAGEAQPIDGGRRSVISVAASGLRGASHRQGSVAVFLNSKPVPVLNFGPSKSGLPDSGMDEVEFALEGVGDGTYVVQLVVDRVYANPAYIIVAGGRATSAPR